MAEKRPPRGKSLEQQAKGPKRAPKRKPPKLSVRQRSKRDDQVVIDRLVNDMSWPSIAKRHGISERQGRRIVAAYAQEQAPSLDEIDPTEEVWGAIQSDDAAIERLRDTRERAKKQNNLNAEIGAERTIAWLRNQKFSKLQQSGLLPKELGTLKHVYEVRHIVQRLLVVVDRIAKGEVEAASIRPELIALLDDGSGGDPANN